MTHLRKTLTALAAGTAMIVAVVGFGLHSAQAQNADKTFEVDAVHSAVLFGARHVGAGYTYGRFNEMAGQFTLGANPSFELTIQAGSLDTGNEKRDGHLRGPDFFNARQFPTITFKSTAAEQKGEVWHVTGDLTMLGKTKQITIPVDVLTDSASFRGKTLGAVHSEFTIQRSDFGMTWGVDNGVVSDQIKLTVALEGVQQE